jgi:site-specific DNA-cytosine methylase
VEIEAFADANLVAKMEAGHLDAAPIWTDLKTFNAKPFRDRIHLITGGYPCQPFSAAGKRLGADDPRHLWPHIYKIVKTIRPVFCFFENVEGHLSLGFKEVQQSLRDLGYRVESGIFSAAECGAPQQRKRLFILAHRTGSEWRPKSQETNEYDRDDRGRKETDGGFEFCCEELANSGCQRSTIIEIKTTRIKQSCWPSRPGQPQHEWEPPRVVANSVSLRESQPERSEQDKRGRTVNESENLGNTQDDNGRGRECGTETGIGTDGIGRRGSSKPGERETKSAVGGTSNGLAYRLDNAELYQSCDNRTDELRLLGNGVVPDTAEKAFTVLFNKIF